MLQDMALIDFGPFYELGKMIKKKRPKDVYLFQSLTLFINAKLTILVKLL